MIVLFFRKEGFYPVECPPGWDAPEKLAEHAALNPGTIKIEDTKGNILWKPSVQ